MRNEQTSGTGRPAADAATPAAAPDFISDAANAIAAIGRMETVIRSDRAAFGRLRVEMTAMAKALGEAKSALLAAGANGPAGRPVDLGALMLDLEGRLNAMLYLVEFVAEDGAAAGLSHDRPKAATAPAVGTPAAAAAQPVPATVSEAPDPLTVALSAVFAAARSVAPPSGEADRVPTVSAVVSRLGRTGEGPGAEAGEEPAPADGTVPSVSMLGAMVEALTANAEALPETEPQPGEAVDASGEDMPAAAETDAAQEVPPEDELLTSFARMEAVPMLAPEIGTAVIFARRDEAPSEAAELAVEAEPEPTPPTEPPPVPIEPASLALVPVPLPRIRSPR